MADLTGQVGIITRATKWSVGWWVEKVSRSPAHHVVVGIGNGGCVSAEPGGVRYRDVTEYGDRIIWTQYKLTPAQATDIAWYADGHIGIDYNFTAFVALGIHYVTRLPIPQWVADRLDQPAHTTCSQLAEDVLRATNIHPIPNTRIPAPKDWYDLATAQGWT